MTRFLHILLLIGLTGCTSDRPPFAPPVRAARSAGTRTVTLAWDPSPVGSGVTGYRLHAGTTTRAYTVTQPAPSTNGSLTLPPGTWYFAVTATNAAGLESDYSDEVAWTVPAHLDWIRVTILRTTNLVDWAPVLTGPAEAAVGPAFYRAAITNWTD